MYGICSGQTHYQDGRRHHRIGGGAVVSELLHEKITRLAEDLSAALAEHDDGQWGLEIRPAYMGRPIVALTREDISARLRVQMLSAKLNAALRDCRPGDWETLLDLEDGYLLFFKNDAELKGLADTFGKMSVSVPAT
jgi:hypothetical protein